MSLFTVIDFCSVSGILPSGQLSAIPWRRSGVKYTNNEAYFDVVEEVDAIIDKNGHTVFAEIQGYVRYEMTKCLKTISLTLLTLLDRLLHQTIRYARLNTVVHESTAL